MELYRKVRRAYFRQGMSKRAIARHFNISRDSVDKMIVYSVPPGYRRTAPIKRPKLDGFTEIIDAWHVLVAVIWLVPDRRIEQRLAP